MFKRVVSISASLLYLSTHAYAKKLPSNCSRVSIVKNQNRHKNTKFNNFNLTKALHQSAVKNKDKKLRSRVPSDVKKPKSHDDKKIKTQKMDEPLFKHITREKVKNAFNKVSNALVDSFAEKPVSSTLKYVVAPPLLIKLALIIANEIHNYRHFPSKMRPEYIMYLIENGCDKRPTKDELDQYRNKKFKDDVYTGDWEMKEKIINHLLEILMTNYLISPYSKVFDQWGYGVIDTFLFRNARDRVKIASKRFLNNKGGSCLSIACYLLSFMEVLGVEARLAFSHIPGMPPGTPQDCHVSLVYKEVGKGENAKWKRIDLPLRFAYRMDDQSLSQKSIGNHLLVLERIEKDDKRRLTEMKCGVIEAKENKSIGEIDIDSLTYNQKVPFLFNW